MFGNNDERFNSGPPTIEQDVMLRGGICPTLPEGFIYAKC